MGAIYRFSCLDCGYSAEVSGGWDRGFLSATQTVICESCNELVDVAVGGDDRLKLLGETEAAELGPCPRCGLAVEKKWGEPYNCPECDGRMERGELIMLWD